MSAWLAGNKYNLVPMAIAFLIIIVIGIPIVTILDLPSFPAMVIGIVCGAIAWPLLTIWLSDYTDDWLR